MSFDPAPLIDDKICQNLSTLSKFVHQKPKTSVLQHLVRVWRGKIWKNMKFFDSATDKRDCRHPLYNLNTFYFRAKEMNFLGQSSK